ncbi:MAG: hypothetical protein IJ848_00870 [Alphaproteobacteria bacterium]|nr:hypothetical protein [Alphaproteobacteria bacterium]
MKEFDVKYILNTQDKEKGKKEMKNMLKFLLVPMILIGINGNISYSMNAFNNLPYIQEYNNTKTKDSEILGYYNTVFKEIKNKAKKFSDDYSVYNGMSLTDDYDFFEQQMKDSNLHDTSLEMVYTEFLKILTEVNEYSNMLCSCFNINKMNLHYDEDDDNEYMELRDITNMQVNLAQPEIQNSMILEDIALENVTIKDLMYRYNTEIMKKELNTTKN